MTPSELAKLYGVLGDNHAISEFRRLEQERATWMSAVAGANSVADQLKQLAGQDYGALQTAKQMYQAHINSQEESIRKMLDPLANIRSSLLADSSLKRMIDEFSKPVAATAHFTKLTDQINGSGGYLQSLHAGVDSSIGQARKVLSETSISVGLQQAMKTFEDTNKHWTVPTALLDSISPLKAWQERVGKLSLPVMDWGSAATLAKLLGREGIESQLAALGINPDGSLNANFEVQEEGIGLSRKAMDLMALLSFIFAVLVPLYQEYSSAQWQASVDNKLEAQADALESQRKMIEALTNLVQKALVQEAKRQEERFVVRERVAVVRSGPEHGSAVVGKLLPREVVRPVSEQGKWIEIGYYHWLHQEYRTGWALKKYFQRVARPDSQGLSTLDQPKPQLPNPNSLIQKIGTAKGAFESAAEVDDFIRSERDQWDH